MLYLLHKAFTVNMKKQLFAGRISNSSEKIANNLKRELGLNNGQLIEYLLQHHGCDNKATSILGVGDKVPKEIQASRRISELRDGTLYYAYLDYYVLARIGRGRLVVADVFQDSVWQVALEYAKFYTVPYRTLQAIEYAQRDPDNYEGWSKERRIKEGVPTVDML